MRILCLNYEYPPVGGGGGRAAAQINAELVTRGHDVRVQTAGLKHLPAREAVDGVEIFRTQSYRKKEDTCTVPEMALFLMTSFAPTLRHVREWKPDVIHVHFAVPTGALAWVVRLVTKTPYVLTAHLGDVPGGVPEQTAGLFRMIQPLTIPIWKRAAAVTAVSRFVADLAEGAYGRRPEVIPNGIRLDPRPQIERRDLPKILMVGRLSEQKNPVLGIEALSSCREYAWELNVIGDGPLRGDVEQAVVSNGLVDRVTFDGWLDSEGVRARMSGADILLMTSRSEGLPMAAIEALNHGLAIVSTRIPGVADLVDHGKNGVLADGDPQAIGKVLRPLLENPEQLLEARRASAARASEFDLATIAASYERVLAAAAR
ncbi:MAG: glycosyltransferase family 4 protein [Chthoniobacterales bacterium]